MRVKASFRVNKSLVGRFRAECRRSGVTMTATLNDLMEQFVSCRTGMRKSVQAMCAKANAAKRGEA
jgi:hypothetical protein